MIFVVAWVLWWIMQDGDEVADAVSAFATRESVEDRVVEVAEELGWEIAPSGLSAWSPDRDRGVMAKPSVTRPLHTDGP